MKTEEEQKKCKLKRRNIEKLKKWVLERIEDKIKVKTELNKFTKKRSCIKLGKRVQDVFSCWGC